MRRMMASVLLLAATSVAQADFTTTFEDFGLSPNSFDNNAGSAGGFVVGGNFFNNSFDPTFGSWSGWSISNTTDKTTPGFMNQYSSVTGSGANGSATYGVGFTFGFPTVDAFHPADSYINLAAGTSPQSIAVTNTTYAYLSMAQGDAFAHAFGPGDFFLLDIRGYTGLSGTGQSVGEVDFYLANFLGSNHYIINNWNTLDLTSLAGAKSLVFGLRSSDNNPDFGINTPVYIAVDNFRTGVSAVPEPSSLILAAIGFVGAIGFGRKQRRVLAGLMTCLFLMSSSADARAGFDPQPGLPGSLAIPKDSPDFQEWAATIVSITRGPQDISNPNSPLASSGLPSSVVGTGTGGNTSGVVSLGDGGSITLGFTTPITNGPGADFAVFENGFLSGAAGSGLAFLELAFVDVSSDGVDFYRFPSISLTQTTTQVGGFGLLDARNLNNLAGKYIAGYGTGFNLDDLVGISPLLDVNRITQVRITDVVGSIDPAFGSRDSLGNLINDPFKTPFASSGFDLSGVGVIHTLSTPEPSSLVLVLSGLGVLGFAYGRKRKTAPITV